MGPRRELCPRPDLGDGSVTVSAARDGHGLRDVRSTTVSLLHHHVVLGRVAVPELLIVAAVAHAELHLVRAWRQRHLEREGVVDDLDRAGDGRTSVAHVCAVGVLLCQPVVRGRADEDLLLERQVLDFDSTHERLFGLLDDDVFQRDEVLV